MTKTAAIIGGGIGGLAAAIALRQAGWRVTVHERQATTPATGTALGIWPAALRALDRLGLGDDVRKTGVSQTGGELRRPGGTRIASMTMGDDIYLISRPSLLTILRDAAADGCDLRFGEPIGTHEPLRSEFDLVVAADGVFSHVREELFGEHFRARYSGSTAWRGTLGEGADSFAEIWGAGVKFGVTPQEGGRTNWFASAARPEGSFRPGAERDALHEIFGGWSDPAVARVLAAVREEGILRHDIYVTPRLPSYVSSNVVLIGDAAHAMTPDLGRGACEALIDAVVLAQKGPIAYDRDRRRTTQRLARMAGAASWLTRQRHGVPLRNGLLKVALR